VYIPVPCSFHSVDPTDSGRSKEFLSDTRRERCSAAQEKPNVGREVTIKENSVGVESRFEKFISSSSEERGRWKGSDSALLRNTSDEEAYQITGNFSPTLHFVLNCILSIDDDDDVLCFVIILCPLNVVLILKCTYFPFPDFLVYNLRTY
jgi:hypothetical protein